jgi:AcrR family transcriptional regulator
MPAVDSTERQDKRAQILDAALAVFSRKGVFGTRIADIAREAGIAYGLVYHYFQNKEEILNTIFEERWTHVTQLLEEAERRGENVEERLRGVARVFLNAYARRPQVVEVLLLEFTRMSKFLEPVHIDHIGGAFQVVTRILERGQKEGEIRSDVSPAILMLLLLGGLQLIIQTQVIGTFEPPEGFADRGDELIVDVFLRGVAVA